MVCSLGGSDTMVDLPNYPATVPSNTVDVSPAIPNFVEFRILSRKLKKDFGIDISGVTTHKDMYTPESGPKPSDVLGAAPPEVTNQPPANFMFDAGTDSQGTLQLFNFQVGTYSDAVIEAELSVYYIDELGSPLTKIGSDMLATDTSIGFTGNPPIVDSWIIVEQEIMLVTAVTSSTTATVTRGQFATVPVTHRVVHTSFSAVNSTWLAEGTVPTGLAISPGDYADTAAGRNQIVAEYQSATGLVRFTRSFSTAPAAGNGISFNPRVWIVQKQDVVIPFAAGFFRSAGRATYENDVTLPYSSVVLISGTVKNTAGLVSMNYYGDYTANPIRTLGSSPGLQLAFPNAPAGTNSDAFIDSTTTAQSFPDAYATISGGATGAALDTPRAVAAISLAGVQGTGTITISGTVDATGVLALNVSGNQNFSVANWLAAGVITGSNTLTDVAASFRDWLNGDSSFSSVYSANSAGPVITVTDLDGSGGTLAIAAGGSLMATASGIGSTLGVLTGRAYAVSFFDGTDNYESSLSSISDPTGPTGGATEVDVQDVPLSTDPRVTKVRLYAAPDGTKGPFYKVAEISNAASNGAYANAVDTITEETLTAQPAYGGAVGPSATSTFKATVTKDGAPWLEMFIPGGATRSNTIDGRAIGGAAAGIVLNADLDNETGLAVTLNIFLPGNGMYQVNPLPPTTTGVDDSSTVSINGARVTY